MMRARHHARRALLGAAVLLGALGPGRAGADPGDDQAEDDIRRLWLELVEHLERASDELEPPLVPPVPRAVRWQARRVSSVAPGACSAASTSSSAAPSRGNRPSHSGCCARYAS